MVSFLGPWCVVCGVVVCAVVVYWAVVSRAVVCGGVWFLGLWWWWGGGVVVCAVGVVVYVDPVACNPPPLG